MESTMIKKNTDRLLFRKILRVLICCAVASFWMQAEASELRKSSQNAEKDDYVVADRTDFDFSERRIDGQFQGPGNSFVDGQRAQKLSQMVRLRSNFRNELRNSKAAVKALVK